MADLTTDSDIPNKTSMKTPKESNRGFETDIASVSGPPADSTMRITNDKTTVLPEGKHVDDIGTLSKYNENYIIDQFGTLYRPVYVGESYVPKDNDLIFNNKYYTTEGLGNCTFCQGAGKVTVERLGLKDCPDCDGTGDVQSQAPDLMQQAQTQQLPQQPSIPQQPNISQPDIPQPEEQEEPEDKDAPKTLKSLFNESYASEDDDGNWITVKGNHIKVGKGQSKQDAVKKFINKKTKQDPNDPDTKWEKSHGHPEGTARQNRINSFKGMRDTLTDKNQIRYDNAIKKKPIEDMTNKELRDFWVKTGGWDRDDSKIISKMKNKSEDTPEDNLDNWEPERDDTGNMDVDADLGNPEEEWDTNQYPSTTNYNDPELAKLTNAELNQKLSEPHTSKEEKEKIESIFDERLDDEIVKDTADLVYDTIQSGGKPKGDLTGSDLLRFQSVLQNRADKKNAFRDYEPELREKARNAWGFDGANRRFLIKALGMNPTAINKSSPTLMDNEDAVKLIEYTKGIDGQLKKEQDGFFDNLKKVGDNYFKENISNEAVDQCPYCKSTNISSDKHDNFKCNDCDRNFDVPYEEPEEDAYEVSNESFTKVVEACGCKKKAQESINNYKNYVSDQLSVLKSRARAGEAVSLMYGLPTVSRHGRKIKGTLAYAGVSLNDRIYLPEELAKGHGMTLPLLLNHSSTAGAEKELDRLDEEMLDCLYNEKDYKVGEVTLTWDPAKLTLFYEGVVDNKFFQKEIDDMDMAVSLGIYYDSNSPRICDESCYTVIKGAEFREVSLVYHAGFPIATIEAVEAELKAKSMKAIEDHSRANSFKDPTGQGNTKEQVEDFYNGEAVAEEELDVLQPNEQPIDVEEKPVGEPVTIDINEDTPIIAEALTTAHDFSIRGVVGMTISNTNGVERYTLDPNMSYETNMVHFKVAPSGAQIFGEEIQLQPKMTTPPALTKEIEKKPNIKFTNSDAPAFKK